MLHRPAGGLEQWRERLLESELYGSALAGQEVVAEAQSAARGITEGTPTVSHPSTLAPFYLALFRAGFEGSLRGDVVGLSSLTAPPAPLPALGRRSPARIGVRPLCERSNGSLLRVFNGLVNGAFAIRTEVVDAGGGRHRLVATARIADESGAPLTVPPFGDHPRSIALHRPSR